MMVRAGPGDRWPWLLVPFHALRRLLPATREHAIHLGLLPFRQFVTALVAAVETPPVSGVTIIDVPGIAQAQLRPQ